MGDTNWWTRPFIALDLETTGVDVETDRIVTATIIRIDAETDETWPTEWLINPGVDIPAGATAVHGITTERAKTEGMEPVRALTEMLAVLDGMPTMAPLVAYNAAFDLTLLDRELRRYELGALALGPVVDPFVIDKAVDKYRKGSRKLMDTARFYGVELSEENAHTSSADALAAGRVAWMLPQRWPEIGAMRLPELHSAQIGWYAEQSASFENYLIRCKRAAKASEDEIAAVHVDRQWPMRKAVA